MGNPNLLNTEPPRLFSPRRTYLSRKRAHPTFETHSFLHNRVLNDFQERLLDIKKDFKSCLFIGNPTGMNLENCDTTQRMDFVSGDELLPIKPDSIDLILNPLTLHWVNDVPGVFSQLKQCLQPNGVLMGALFGGETLSELKQCLFQAEVETSDKATLRTAPMITPQMLGALLQRAGFALPVVDRDRVQVRYGSLQELLHDLRGMGETSKMVETHPLTRTVLDRTEALYRKQFSEEGKLVATFDILYLTGWAPHSSQQTALPRGSATVSLTKSL